MLLKFESHFKSWLLRFGPLVPILEYIGQYRSSVFDRILNDGSTIFNASN